MDAGGRQAGGCPALRERSTAGWRQRAGGQAGGQTPSLPGSGPPHNSATLRRPHRVLSADADMSGELKARYEDGVLHVHISKIKGTTRPEGRIVEIA